MLSPDLVGQIVPTVANTPARAAADPCPKVRPTCGLFATGWT